MSLNVKTIATSAAMLLASSIMTFSSAHAEPRWSGFYIGAGLGVSSLDAEMTDHSEYVSYGSMKADDIGVIGSFRAGYDYQFGNAVVGIIGEYAMSNVDAHGGAGAYVDCDDVATSLSSDVKGVGSLRGRAGLAVGNALVYATAGAAWLRGKDRTECDNGDYFAESSDSTTALVYGAGIEMMVNGNWTLGFEYLRYDVGLTDNVLFNDDFGTPVPDSPASFDKTMDTVMVTLNYRFNGN